MVAFLGPSRQDTLETIYDVKREGGIKGTIVANVRAMVFSAITTFGILALGLFILGAKAAPALEAPSPA